MYKCYDDYKYVNIKWIKRVPSHWKQASMRELLQVVSIKNHSEEILLSVTREKGVILRNIESKDENHNYIPDDLSNYKYVRKGQFVVNKMKSWQGSYGVSEYDGIVSPAYYVFKLKSDNTKFFDKAIRSRAYIPFFAKYSTGIRVGQWDFDINKINTIPFFIPPKPEQDQIVRYLDWKTSGIDRFIQQKKKQIKRLEEYKFTKMDELVTKGLDNSVPMKDSEVEWLRNIPAHWDVHTIKQHFQIRKRIAGREGFDVLSITQQGLKVKDIASNEGQMAQNYSGYQFVYPGDFAMNHMDLITGYVDLSDKFGVTSPDYRVFTLVDTENCYPEFYLRVFQIGYKRRIFYKFGKGAANQGRWRLPQRAFYNYSIQVPPFEEQIAIEKECVVLERQTDELIEALEKEIELLQELRTKLIADVVTGQIDVRDEIIPEYDNTEGNKIDDELENEVDFEKESENEA